MNAPVKSGELSPAHDITLDDKWTLERGRAFMTGTQALIRLPMLQRERDLKAGLNTAGYITGYRGSPVTSVDQTAIEGQEAPRRAPRQVPPRHERRPGGDRRRWGTQQTNLFEDAKYDGRVLHVVRQGPGRRPLRRRVQARQQRRLFQARRRAGAGRRRPRCQIVLHRPPVGPHPECLRHSGAVSSVGAGIHRLRPACLGHEPLHRPVGVR